MNDICDKCKKRRARHYHCSSLEPTISLCDECDSAYTKFMAEAKTRFFSDEIQPKELDTTISEDEINTCEIEKIEIGDKVKCLNCGKTIALDNKTFLFDFDAEYIHCPHCKAKIDVQYYLLQGEKVK